MSILPEYKKMDVREGNAESWGKGIGYNQAVDECQSALDAAVGEAASEESLRKFIVSELNKEKKRNIGNDGHEYSEVCSCGICHHALILSRAISTHIKQVFQVTDNVEPHRNEGG